MCIITSVLCLSNGFVNDIRNLNNSRTHGNPYGIKGPEPTKIISIQFNKMKKKNQKEILLARECSYKEKGSSFLYNTAHSVICEDYHFTHIHKTLARLHQFTKRGGLGT
jgi:hypothetical protein